MSGHTNYWNSSTSIYGVPHYTATKVKEQVQKEKIAASFWHQVSGGLDTYPQGKQRQGFGNHSFSYSWATDEV